MLTDSYLQYHSSTQIFEKREYAPFPDISVCNLQPNLQRVQSMKDYMSRLDFLLALTNNQIDQEILSAMKEKPAMFQNLGNSTKQMGRDFIVDCQWLAMANSSTKKITIPCAMNISHALYTEEFGQCYTFTTLLLPPDLTRNKIYRFAAMFFIDDFTESTSNSQQLTLGGMTSDHKTGVKVSVHEKGTLPDLNIDGIDLATGESSTVYLHPMRRKTQPSPYSDCITKVNKHTVMCVWLMHKGGESIVHGNSDRV